MDVALAVGVAGVVLMFLGWLVNRREQRRRRPPRPCALWLQFEHCHEDLERGVVTATGYFNWGGQVEKINAITDGWRPPFEAQISANGRDIDVIIVDVTTTVGSRQVEWRAQDKCSYMAQHTFREVGR